MLSSIVVVFRATLFLACVNNGKSLVVDTPSNLTVSLSDTVQLSCYTSLKETVEWTLSKDNKYYVVYSADTVHEMFSSTGRFNVTSDSGFYNLTITNVSLNDAGEYICNEDAGYGFESRVLLQVRETSDNTRSTILNTTPPVTYQSTSVIDKDEGLLLPILSGVVKHSPISEVTEIPCCTDTTLSEDSEMGEFILIAVTASIVSAVWMATGIVFIVIWNRYKLRESLEQLLSRGKADVPATPGAGSAGNCTQASNEGDKLLMVTNAGRERSCSAPY